MDLSWDAILSNCLLFVLIFGLSATVNVENLRRQIKNRQAFGAGLGIQYILMPLVGFVVVKSFTFAHDQFSPAMGLVLLVVTSSPGGSLSNWWCSTFNAELALSVAFSAVSSIASMALLPMNVFLYTYLVYRNRNLDQNDSDNDVAIISNATSSSLLESANDSSNDSNAQSNNILQSLDFLTIFITLGLALAAMGLGILCGYYNDTVTFHRIAHGMGSVSGVILICFSLFLTSGAKGDDTAWYTQDWSLFVATILPCCVGILASHVISRSIMRLTPPETVAITIECCYQNTGIALSVAITMFDDPVQRAQAVAVPLVYGMADAILVGLYCLYAWKAGWTKAPASENLLVVILKSYEIAPMTEAAPLEDDNDAADRLPTVDSKDQDNRQTDNDDDDDSGQISPASTTETAKAAALEDVEQGTPPAVISDASVPPVSKTKDDTEVTAAVAAEQPSTNIGTIPKSPPPPESIEAVADEKEECSPLELCGSWTEAAATTTDATATTDPKLVQRPLSNN